MVFAEVLPKVDCISETFAAAAERDCKAVYKANLIMQNQLGAAVSVQSATSLCCRVSCGNQAAGGMCTAAQTGSAATAA